MSTKPKQILAVDIGGTYIRFGVVELSTPKPTIIGKKILNTPQSYETGFQIIKNNVQDFANNYEINGVGIGIPGIVDYENQILQDAINVADWVGKPLVADLITKTNLPTKLCHDVGAAALGEALFGSSTNHTLFNYIIWGTGFGGCKVHRVSPDHMILTGFEPGHHNLDLSAEKCSCGSYGCAELTIGGGSLKSTYPNIESIPDNSPVWGKITKVAGAALTNTQLFHQAPHYILSGGVISHRPFLLDEIKKEFEAYDGFINVPEFSLSKLGDDAALLGVTGLFTHTITFI